MGIWSSTANVNTAKRAASGFGISSAAVMVLGYTTLEIANTELFNGISWVNGNNANTARASGGGFGTQSAGVCVGGQLANNKTTEIFNGTTWSASGATINSHQGPAVFGTQTAGMVAGHNGGLTVETFNGTTWAAGINLLGNLFESSSAGTQSSALMVNGCVVDPTAVTTVYSWNNTAWSTATANSVAARLHAGCGPSNGLAMKAGGGSNTVAINNTEVWNGTSWAADSNMITARNYVSNGQMGGMAVAGWDGTQNIATSEIFRALNITPLTTLNDTSLATSMQNRIVSPLKTLSSGAQTPIIITARVVYVPLRPLSITPNSPMIKVPLYLGIPLTTLGISGFVPNFIPVLIFISVDNFPTGKTVSYKITDVSGSVIQNWTNSGVQEVVADISAGVSSYGLQTNLVGDVFQGRIFWKTNDVPPKVAVESYDAYRTYTYGMRGGISGINVGVGAILSIVNLLLKYVKNKKELKKIGTTWYLLIYDNDGTTIIINKALKDSTGNEISDITAGLLAKEMASSV